MAQLNETQTGRGPLVGTLNGVVTSDKRDKTCSVEVKYSIKHPKYGKYLRRSTRYQVHDQDNAAKLGDTVEIVCCRPISKTKTWRLVKIVKSQ